MLVILSLGIIVLLAGVAFFMGGFSSSSSGAKTRSDFNEVCVSWANTNCASDGSDDGVPSNVCRAYQAMEGVENPDGTDCSHTAVATSCGCVPPFNEEGDDTDNGNSDDESEDCKQCSDYGYECGTHTNNCEEQINCGSCNQQNCEACSGGQCESECDPFEDCDGNGNCVSNCQDSGDACEEDIDCCGEMECVCPSGEIDCKRKECQHTDRIESDDEVDAD